MTRTRGRLAELVIERRHELAMTQRELATRVGVSPGAIGQVELGTAVLSEERTAMLGVALELDDAGRVELLAARLARADELALPGRGVPGRRPGGIPAAVERLEAELGDVRGRLDRVERLLGDLLGGDEV